MKKYAAAVLPSKNVAAGLNPPLSPFFKGGLRGNFRCNQDKSWQVASAAKTDPARFLRKRCVAFTAVFFFLAAGLPADDKQPGNISEPVFRESPVAIEQQGDVSIAEPPLRKQTFIPDSPQFGLPDVPNIYSAGPVEVERRLDFDWRSGNYDSNSSALSYLVSTGAARLDISVSALSSRGQSADGKLSRRAQSFRAAYADRSSSRFSLDIDADVSGKSVWTLDRTFASIVGAVKYHPADGAVLSARAASQNITSRHSISDMPTADASRGELSAEARLIPDADTDIYVGGSLFGGNTLASRDFSVALAGINRVVFDKALLSAEARNEAGHPHSTLAATLLVADGSRVFVSRRSGYKIIKPDDVFPDGLFASAPGGFSWIYPEVAAISLGAEYAPRSRTFVSMEYTRREIKNHFYLAASAPSALLAPAYLAAVDAPGLAAEIKHRLGNFELNIGFLYNTGEPVPGFPKVKTSSRLGYATKNISFGLSNTVETDRLFGVSPRLKAADIFLTGADAEIRLTPGLFALVSIRNIFSTPAEIQPGFISDKPEYLLGVKASF